MGCLAMLWIALETTLEACRRCRSSVSMLRRATARIQHPWCLSAPAAAAVASWNRPQSTHGAAVRQPLPTLVARRDDINQRETHANASKSRGNEKTQQRASLHSSRRCIGTPERVLPRGPRRRTPQGPTLKESHRRGAALGQQRGVAGGEYFQGQKELVDVAISPDGC
jgi:hypothetical protein